MENSFSLSQFNNLKAHDKYDLVFTKGDFVNYYLKGDIRYALYSLFKFYVEIEYNLPNNEISNLVAFEDGLLLDRYWILTNLQ